MLRGWAVGCGAFPSRSQPVLQRSCNLFAPVPHLTTPCPPSPRISRTRSCRHLPAGRRRQGAGPQDDGGVLQGPVRRGGAAERQSGRREGAREGASEREGAGERAMGRERRGVCALVWP